MTELAETERDILVDARCLQHPDFAGRGIGLHLASMLGAPQRRRFAVTLLFDPDLPPPAAEHAALGDAVTMTGYQASRSGGIFLQPASFSFPTGRIGRLLRAASVRKVAVVLDFIPLDLPELYLRTARGRRAYAAGLAGLRRYDRYLAISQATQARLHAVIPHSIGQSEVTGVAIRPSLCGAGSIDRLGFGERDGIMVVAGDDPRKNPEVAVCAQLGAAITFVGIHDAGMQARLAGLHRAQGGAPERLIFAPRLSDAGLAAAYARARLVIAPSRAEGFSMPVIEAMAQGTPVLAADEPAQAELIGAPDRFAPDDAEALHRKATALLTDARHWAEVQGRQAGRWSDFTLAAVGARFWAPIEALAGLAAPAIRRAGLPRIAVLSPLPPARSGCADHTGALLGALAGIADVTAFSDTRGPCVPDGVAFGGRADATVMRAPRFDAIIAILGNSPFHLTETRLLLDYGAAAVLHDSRLSGFYRGALGLARALGVAAAETGRDIDVATLDAWERDQSAMPARFLGEIAAAATPLIVHAADTARFIATRHGRHAQFVPFAPYRLPDAASLTAAGRAAARARLGVTPDAVLIASFGAILPGKDPARMIEAFGQLAARRACRFALVGSGDPGLIAALQADAAGFGIPGDTLMLGAMPVTEPIYRDYLAAADVAVQLRRAPPGSISGALADAIAAGVPCVASATLVAALDPPDYVTAVADDAPPDVIGAAIGAVLDAGCCDIAAQRAGFLERRSMARYAADVLGAVMRGEVR